MPLSLGVADELEHLLECLGRPGDHVRERPPLSIVGELRIAASRYPGGVGARSALAAWLERRGPPPLVRRNAAALMARTFRWSMSYAPPRDLVAGRVLW